MPFFGIEAKYPARSAAEAYTKQQGGRWILWEEDGWWRISQETYPPKGVSRYYVVVDGVMVEFTDNS